MGDRVVNNELAQMWAGMKQNERMEKIKKAVETVHTYHEKHEEEQKTWEESGRDELKEMWVKEKTREEKIAKEEAEKKMRVIKYAVEHCGQEKYDEIYKKNKIEDFKNKKEVNDYHQADEQMKNTLLINKAYSHKLTAMNKYILEIDAYTGTNTDQDFEEYFDNYEKIAKVKNNGKKAVNFWIDRINKQADDIGVNEKDMRMMPTRMALNYLKTRMRYIYCEEQIKTLERFGFDYEKYTAYHNNHKEVLNMVANAKKITWWDRLMGKFNTQKVYFKVGDKNFGSKTEKFDDLNDEGQREFLEHLASKVGSRPESLYDTIDSDMLGAVERKPKKPQTEEEKIKAFVANFNRQMIGTGKKLCL